MKNILVIYYSQSGQLKEILDSLLAPIIKNDGIEITFEEILPDPPYPFPWTSRTFCDAFPESFQEIPCDIKPLKADPDKPYDLVILAYTVWYLAPAIPISAFLQSDDARHLIKDRPVVTVIGCRNMWLLTQEKIKKRIFTLGGRLAGNIVFTDRTPNLIGVATIAHWMFSGRKDRLWKIMPKPGVSTKDIRNAGRFGLFLKEAIANVPFQLDQTQLNQLGATRVVPAYILFEQRIQKIFSIWSKFIRQKGGPGSPLRKKRVRAFYYYLWVAIFVLAPLATVLSFAVRLLKKDKIQSAVDYYSQNKLKA